MATAYNMIIGFSLVVLLALLVGMFITGVWRRLTHRLTRGGLAVFLIGAGIATVEAQKRLYVDITKETGDPVPAEIVERYECDHTFKTIGEAFEFLRFKAFNDVDIFVAPGVYPPVKVPYIDPCPYPVAVQLAPYFDVTAIGEPGTVIIDGWGISNAVTSSEQIACPRAWHGFVFSNAVCGAVGGSFTRCVAKCCEVGFSDSYLLHCIATRNTSVGALNCGLKYCTVIGNRGFTGKDAIYDHTGVQDCRIEGTIVWDNTKDGQPANGVNPPFDATGVDTDSIFVDAAHENYRLRMGSPYINLCEYFAYTFLEYDDDPRMLGESTSDMPMFDFDGNPRCRRGLVDFGPFEYQPTNDHQTITAPEPVEFAWIDEKCLELLAACGGDYDKAVLMKSANPVDISLPEPLRTYYTIWESYVADLDPTDSNQTFRAHISIENGVSHVWPEPNSPRRKYTIFGKEKLLDEKWQENLPGARFFKIKVGLK